MFDTPVGRILNGPAAALEPGVRAWQAQPVDWDMLAEATPDPLPGPDDELARQMSGLAINALQLHAPAQVE